jgi:hypothetical protein
VICLYTSAFVTNLLRRLDGDYVCLDTTSIMFQYSLSKFSSKSSHNVPKSCRFPSPTDYLGLIQTCGIIHQYGVFQFRDQLRKNALINLFIVRHCVHKLFDAMCCIRHKFQRDHVNSIDRD